MRAAARLRAHGPGSSRRLDPFVETVRAPRRFDLVCAGLLVAYLCVFSFYYLDHNDFMYVGAVVHGGTLYRDLHYVQAPLGFHVLSQLAGLAPSGWLYLTLRGASLLFAIAAIFSLGFGGLRSAGARVVFLLTCLASVPLVRISAEIGNYALALLLIGWGTLLTQRAVSRPGRQALIPLFGAGLLMGLAGSVKLNHFVLGVIPGIAALMRPRRDWPAAAGVVLAGGLVGTAPIWFELLTAPEAFLFHNYLFHTEIANPARGIDAATSAKILATELGLFAIVYGPLLFHDNSFRNLLMSH